MNRSQNYSTEYKQEMVKQYLSKKTSVVKFCEEEGLKRSTFFKWLAVYRKANEVVSKSLIDVTKPVKTVNNVINEECKFSLKINNYSLEFNIKELPQVLMVIKNG